jgi:hypothetical protein
MNDQASVEGEQGHNGRDTKACVVAGVEEERLQES